jgi:hypothetical protein
MQDAEDLAYFWMNAPFEDGAYKDVLLRVLARINDVPSDDPELLADFESWVTKTKAKIAERENI